MDVGPFSPRSNVPVGGAPSGLTSWFVTTVDPTGTRKPAGTIAYHVDGVRAWWNYDGTAAGWVPVGDIASTVALVAAGQDLRGQILLLARSRSGIAMPRFLFDDFALVAPDGLPLGRRAAGAGGTASMSITEQTAVEASTSAGAGGYWFLSPAGVGPVRQGALFASRFWIGMRAAVILGGAMDALCQVGCDVGDSGLVNRMRFGAVGNVSVVNFGLFAGANQVDSGVPLDGAKHTFEIWRTTGDVNFAVDGIVRGTCPPPAAWGGGTLLNQVYCYNGGSAVDRRIRVDWYGAAFEAG